MSDHLKENLTSTKTWQRGLFMLLFALLYSIAELVLVAVTLFQFASALVTGHPNRRVLNLGQSLATYLYQIVLFQAFKSEEKPYPFDAWPKGAPSAKAANRSAAPAPVEPPSDETETGV